MSRGRTRQFSEDEDIELYEGRPEPVLPYSMLGDWVMLALQVKKVRHPALSLYWALVAHVNANRAKKGDRKVWPTQKTLAKMLGYSEGKKIKPYLDELVAIDAIEILTKPVPGGGFRVQSTYVIHKSPPPDYDGMESLQDFYNALKAEQEAERAAQQTAREAIENRADEDTNEPPAAAAGGVQESTSDGFIAVTGDVFPGAEMSPWPGAEMSPWSRGRNEPINKTKKQDEVNKIGGAFRLPPEPPADLTAGCVDPVVTSKTEFVGDQQTARAKTVAAQHEMIWLQEEIAVQGVETDMQVSAAAPETASTPSRHTTPAVDATVQAPSVAVDATDSANDTRVTPGRAGAPVSESEAVFRSCAVSPERLGRRPKKVPDQSGALFAEPNVRRAPVPECPSCAGDGWVLGADRAPIEPAVRCECTTPDRAIYEPEGLLLG
ncbi:hypothetical protein [Nocardia acidivorans]|uniref:hypothetical protein n=1 Tax=Nocardia acidivorans TaxID=404580 RepID=UPI00082CFC44|nr:hypothetical protein [Nocardia acidivorans]